ncbi:MAG: hypothetical protein WDN72_11040 [Alphaproteobacteria bacterium]
MLSFLRKTLKEATAVPVRNAGPLGIAYGKQDEPALREAAAGMQAVVVEPGFYSAPPLPNAYAYVPLSGFHSDNLATAPCSPKSRGRTGSFTTPAASRSPTRTARAHGSSTTASKACAPSCDATSRSACRKAIAASSSMRSTPSP